MIGKKYIKFLHVIGLTNLKSSEVEEYCRALDLNSPLARKVKDEIREELKGLYIVPVVFLSIVIFLCFALAGLDPILGEKYVYRIPASILLVIVALTSFSLVVFDLKTSDKRIANWKSTIPIGMLAISCTFLLFSLNSDSQHSSVTEIILAIAIFIIMIIFACWGVGIALDQSVKKAQPSGRCFPSKTLVDTPEGPRQINELHISDGVCTYDMVTGSIEPSTILDIQVYEQSEIWCICMDGKPDLRTTSGHTFLVRDQWKMASKIEVGDFIQAFENVQLKEFQVTSSKSENTSEKVFSLVVAKNYNFIADGALVHCFTYFRKTRMLLWDFLIFIKVKKSRAVRATNCLTYHPKQ